MLRLLSQWVGKLPVALKLSLLMAFLLGLTITIMWGLVSKNLNTLLDKQVDVFGETVANQTARSAAELILAEDLLGLNFILGQVTQAPNIVYARISNQKEQSLAESTNESYTATTFLEQSNNVVVYSSPIKFQDVIVGTADIRLDKSIIQDGVDRTFKLLTLVGIALFSVSFFFSLVLGKHITEPIKILTNAILLINKGDWETRITEKRHDEFGVLIDNFNGMADTLKERQQLKKSFDRYIDSAIADQVIDSSDDSKIPLHPVNATVLFIDIAQFTIMCEKTKPRDIATILNRFYSTVLKASNEFGGTVDKFIGDAAMVVFGATNEDSEHAYNALRTCHLFLKLVRETPSKPPLGNQLNYRLGMHSGEMLTGTLGTEDRLQYTVIGDSVNIASSLCSQAPLNQVLLSEHSKQKIDQLSHSYFQRLGELQIKGKVQTITGFTTNQLPLPSLEKLT